MVRRRSAGRTRDNQSLSGGRREPGSPTTRASQERWRDLRTPASARSAGSRTSNMPAQGPQFETGSDARAGRSRRTGTCFSLGYEHRDREGRRALAFRFAPTTARDASLANSRCIATRGVESRIRAPTSTEPASFVAACVRYQQQASASVTARPRLLLAHCATGVHSPPPAYRYASCLCRAFRPAKPRCASSVVRSSSESSLRTGLAHR
jgi:hypothetical protein